MLTLKKINVAEHAEELYRMDIKAFARPFDFASRSVAETVSYLDGCDVYFGCVGETAVGSLAFKKHLGRVEVMQVIVLPEHQNKGYGTQMMKHFLTLIPEERIWLVTHPKNTAALRLYLGQGFTITGWKDNYYGDGQPRLVLEKE